MTDKDPRPSADDAHVLLGGVVKARVRYDRAVASFDRVARRLTVDELRKLAKHAGVTGCSSAGRAEILDRFGVDLDSE